MFSLGPFKVLVESLAHSTSVCGISQKPQQAPGGTGGVILRAWDWDGFRRMD